MMMMMMLKVQHTNTRAKKKKTPLPAARDTKETPFFCAPPPLLSYIQLFIKASRRVFMCVE
tara:strand:- start:3424 stop:3606 length:183 start_codon:yes stop_codon:yes gene_type:complete